MRAARAYMLVICEFWHSTRPRTSLHAHGSSRFWEHFIHPAPPALSYKSTHALHSAADRSDEVLQPGCPFALQYGLVVPLHWLAAVAAAAPAPSAADRASSRASSSAEGLRQRELIGRGYGGAARSGSTTRRCR